MKHYNPVFECVTPDGSIVFTSCNPCSPDEVIGGSQCNPCNPCAPDQIKGGTQCNPCNPCAPDQIKGGTQCNPCNPCSPDQIKGGTQCNPCNPCSPDQMHDGTSGSSSSCFISSACAESLGLPDDCDELKTLRAFRDRRKKEDEDFLKLVEEYYRIAPEIVDSINLKDDRAAIYADIYSKLVEPCVRLIKQQRENEAVDLYVKEVRKLQGLYGK